MTLAMDDVADVVQCCRQADNDLGILIRKTVVVDNAWLHSPSNEQTQELDCNVRYDLDMHRAVIVYVHPVDGCHI